MHRVIMVRPALGEVPSGIYKEAAARFREIAEGVEGIGPESPFWASVRVSRLILEVRGWSFIYTLDDETLRVTEAHKP